MELSGGMKRRLMIVRALVHKPKFLILDEPTAGVDVELRSSMWEFIKELSDSGTTILLTTHYLEEVEALCNKVAIISKGKIVENTTTKELIGKLDKEVFVITPKKALKSLPKDIEKKYH
jgi:ABC-2 type transport system ATP-binding protein